MLWALMLLLLAETVNCLSPQVVKVGIVEQNLSTSSKKKIQAFLLFNFRTESLINIRKWSFFSVFG